jgi:iron complex transport system ATP-binding protein
MVLESQSIPPALQARSLFVPRGSRDVVIDVNLEVHTSSVVALIGPNGSGKTTLLKALAGLIPCRGSIHVQGRSLESMDRRQRAQQVAYVPQQSLLDAPMAVCDVVAQGRLARAASFGRPSALDRSAVDEAMTATDVTQFATRPFTSLSHGERHRVLIARGLATQAPVLLLDEPTAGLDIEHVLSLLSLVKDLARAGRAVLMVLHPIGEVQQAASTVAVLSQGKIVAHGSTNTVLSPLLINEVYNVEAIVGGAWAFRQTTSTQPGHRP